MHCSFSCSRSSLAVGSCPRGGGHQGRPTLPLLRSSHPFPHQPIPRRFLESLGGARLPRLRCPLRGWPTGSQVPRKCLRHRAAHPFRVRRREGSPPHLALVRLIPDLTPKGDMCVLGSFPTPLSQCMEALPIREQPRWLLVGRPKGTLIQGDKGSSPVFSPLLEGLEVPHVRAKGVLYSKEPSSLFLLFSKGLGPQGKEVALLSLRSPSFRLRVRPEPSRAPIPAAVPCSREGSAGGGPCGSTLAGACGSSPGSL